LSVPHPALPWYRPAHNILIQSAVEYGIPGLLLMLAMWYEQFAEAGRARGGDAIGEFGIALQAGIIGIFVSGLSLGVLWTKYTWLAFSLIALYRAASLHATMDHRE
jgi:O-antigen ligase